MKTISMRRKAILAYDPVKYTLKIDTRCMFEAMRALSSPAFNLLLYYGSKSSGWAFSDKNISDTIGINQRSVKRARKELVDLGYLILDTIELADIIIIGKRTVQDYKNGHLEVVDSDNT